MNYESMGYIVGRLVDVKPMEEAGGFLRDTRLVYVYEGVRDSLDMPPDEHLLASNLLIAPQLVNRSPWSRGAIHVIGHVPLGPGHVLDDYCYRFRTGRDFDEFGYVDKNGTTLLLAAKKQLAPPVEPAIEMRIGNAKSLDTEISRELGLAIGWS
jgi:hypothetical protein